MEILKYLVPKDFDPQMLVIRAITVLGTLVLAYIVLRLFNRTLKRTGDLVVESKRKSHRPAQAARAQTVIGLVGQLGRVLIIAVAAVMVLDEVGVDVAPILAGAGVVGLAVGFGAQSLVKDFFSGLCLILENQITIGDWVTINGKSGFVEVLNFRITVLRDADGTIHVFPNGSINQLSNSTHVWSAIVLDIPVPYGQDYEMATKTFKDLAANMKKEEQWAEKFLDDIEVLGLQDFSDRGMVIRCRIKTVPGVQWATGREYRSRLYDEWKRQGIEVPVTARNLIMTSGPTSLAS
jgi:moderate conductance mechanosensitive channel